MDDKWIKDELTLHHLFPRAKKYSFLNKKLVRYNPFIILMVQKVNTLNRIRIKYCQRAFNSFKVILNFNLSLIVKCTYQNPILKIYK